MENKIKYKLNYKFVPNNDPRDFKINFNHMKNIKLPPVVSLKETWGPVYDQGSIGSCVANSIAGCVRFCALKNSLSTFDPSRLFVYYNGRTLPHYDVNVDSGMTIKDGYKCVSKYRVCSETKWPYYIENFNKRPTPNCYDEAIQINSNFKYYSVDHNIHSLKTCLYEGFPISFGLLIYDSFQSDQVFSTGCVPIPDFYTERCLGGHAITLVGYDDYKQAFIVANSWSDNWGANGFCYIPYNYVLNTYCANDFWTVRAYDIVKPSTAENVVKPVENVVKPVENVLHPVENVLHPVENVDQLLQSSILKDLIQKLLENILNPVENVVKPVENVVKPVENVVKPVENVVKPVENVVKPLESVDQLLQSSTFKDFVKKLLENVPHVDNVVKPVDNVVKPVENVVKPVENVVKPVENVVKPVENVVKPFDDKQAEHLLQSSVFKDLIQKILEKKFKEFMDSFILKL